MNGRAQTQQFVEHVRCTLHSRSKLAPVYHKTWIPTVSVRACAGRSLHLVLRKGGGSGQPSKIMWKRNASAITQPSLALPTSFRKVRVLRTKKTMRT
jgi:hypothetical protein